MADSFAQAMQQHSDHNPSEEEQVGIGKPTKMSLQDEHARFLETVLGLIDAGKIDTKRPES